MKSHSILIAFIMTITLLSSCNNNTNPPYSEYNTTTTNFPDTDSTNDSNDNNEDSTTVLMANEVVDSILNTQTLNCRTEDASTLNSKSISTSYTYEEIYPNGEAEISKTFTLKVSFFNKNNRKMAIVLLLEEGKFRQILLDENRNIVLRGQWTNPSLHATRFIGEYEFVEGDQSSVILSLLGSSFLKFNFKDYDSIKQSTVTFFPNSFALPLEIRNASPQPISLLETQTVFEGRGINEELCAKETNYTDFNASSFEDFFNLFISDNELICNTENRTASGFSFIDSSYPVSTLRNGHYSTDSYRDIYIFNLGDNFGNNVTRIREITTCKSGDPYSDSGCRFERNFTVSRGTFANSSKINTIEIFFDGEKIDFTFRKVPQNHIAVTIENSSKYNDLGWVYRGDSLKIKSFVDVLCHNNL